MLMRRRFLTRAAAGLLSLAAFDKVMSAMTSNKIKSSAPITLFLGGDVMPGRGIDQILLHPSDPTLYEPYVRNAKRYVEIGEQVNGEIAKPVGFDYIWGDALSELNKAAPDVRIINLETSITSSDEFWPAKGIHYRMNPKNIPCLTAAKIDCCVLANNHVLDWGYAGLAETLATLKSAGIKTAGLGANLREAQAGVNFLDSLSDRPIARIADAVREVKRPGDVVVASLHWGENWGYDIPRKHVEFARGLIDRAMVDVVHGHSSHHPIGIEDNRLALSR